MPQSVEELISKAIDMTAIGSGGELLRDQADKFIDLTVDESKLLKMVRIQKVTNPKGELDRLNIGEPVTELANEIPIECTCFNTEQIGANTANPGYSNTNYKTVYTPVFDKIQYNTAKSRSAFNVTKDAEIANIEKEGIRNTVMKAFAKRMATDMELLALHGNTQDFTGHTRLERLLRVNNGWYGMMAGCFVGAFGPDACANVGDPGPAHVVNAGGKNVSKYLFSKMIKTMPKKYLMMFDDLRFFVSPTIYQNYLEELGERATDLGDKAITTGVGLQAYGVPIIRIPLMLESCTEFSGTTDGLSGYYTYIFLTVPKNLIFVVLRQFVVYWDFKPRWERWENTTFSNTDFTIENVDACVIATNVCPESCTRYGAVSEYDTCSETGCTGSQAVGGQGGDQR